MEINGNAVKKARELLGVGKDAGFLSDTLTLDEFVEQILVRELNLIETEWTLDWAYA